MAVVRISFLLTCFVAITTLSQHHAGLWSQNNPLNPPTVRYAEVFCCHRIAVLEAVDQCRYKRTSILTSRKVTDLWRCTLRQLVVYFFTRLWCEGVSYIDYVLPLSVFVPGVVHSGMMCDLDMTEGGRCIRRSLLTTETSDSTCIVVVYHLSSNNVQLTLDLLDNHVLRNTYTLLPNKTVKRVSWMGDVVNLQLTASRYLNSTEDVAYALLYSVEFMPCSSEAGTNMHKMNTKCVEQLSSRGLLFTPLLFTLATVRL